MAKRRTKILVAWDGSPAAATAFPVARILGSQLSADVVALNVSPTGLSGLDLATLSCAGRLDLEGLGLRVEVGEPTAGILRAASDPAIEIVVLTTHGRDLEVGRQLGSVAERVIARTRKPVLLIRPEAAAEIQPQAVNRLLLPCDGTPTTATALRPVTKLASRLGASIDLLYVTNEKRHGRDERGTIHLPRYVDQQYHEWPQWQSDVSDRLMKCYAACPPDVPVQVFLARGQIGPQIAAFAVRHSSSAIVLVRRSRLQVGRALALRAVLELTPCPVILVGAPQARHGTR